MKYLLLLIFLIPFAVSAQFSPGDKFIGGTASLTIQRDPAGQDGEQASKVNDLSLQPIFGVLINEKLSIGGHLGYNTRYAKSVASTPDGYTNIEEDESYGYSAGVILRRYLALSEKFVLAAHGYSTLQRGVSEFSFNNKPGNEYDRFTFSLGVRPTFIFFPAEKWGLEAAIGGVYYAYGKNTTRRDTAYRDDVVITEEKFNSLNFRLGGTLIFGFSYYFRK